MENRKQAIYEKYNIKNFEELKQVFELKTMSPLEDLEIDDATVYHSFKLILDKVKENSYNPLEEKILLITTFLNSFYEVDYEDFSEIMRAFGTFKIYYLFKNILNENDFYIEYISLYNNYVERLNNLGIIIINEGKEIIKKIEDFVSDISPETISNLIEEVNSQLAGTGILEELGIEKKN